MDADGADVKWVTKLKGIQARPCWSPDGIRLAFTRNRDGKYDTHAVSLDGTGLVRLTDGFDTGPITRLGTRSVNRWHTSANRPAGSSCSPCPSGRDSTLHTDCVMPLRLPLAPILVVGIRVPPASTIFTRRSCISWES
jgi:hypothetical protein